LRRQLFCSWAGLHLPLFGGSDLTGVSLPEDDAWLELLCDDKLHRCKGRLNDRKCLSNLKVWTGRDGGRDLGWLRQIVDEKKTVSPAGMVWKKKIRGADDEAKDSDRTFVAQI
jgi:hypothetical protein